MMKKSLIGIALASGVFGGTVVHAKDASAWWTRQYGSVLSTHKSGERVYSGKAEYPVFSTSSMSMANAATINVETFGLRSDSRTRVQICAAHWGGSGESCSPTKESSGSGHVAFRFAGDEAVWDDAAHFPYVVAIGWGPSVVTEVVRVNGIFITN
jgi:hypothetical protein